MATKRVDNSKPDALSDRRARMNVCESEQIRQAWKNRERLASHGQISLQQASTQETFGQHALPNLLNTHRPVLGTEWHSIHLPYAGRTVLVHLVKKNTLKIPQPIHC